MNGKETAILVTIGLVILLIGFATNMNWMVTVGFEIAFGFVLFYLTLGTKE